MATERELEKDFSHLIERDRLAHGYILFGSGDIASKGGESMKVRFAKDIARKLEGNDSQVLTDTMLLDAREESGIDDIRRANKFLWQKPVAAPRRTLIIADAEYLTLPAEQAILKTAEEPPPHALVFLIVKHPNLLIAPLASRFQKIFFSGENRPESSKEMYTDLSRSFQRSSIKERSAILKEITQDSRTLQWFIADMMRIAYRDPKKHWRLLKNLAHRTRLISQYNVNKRLQLEAALLEMPSS